MPGFQLQQQFQQVTKDVNLGDTALYSILAKLRSPQKHDQGDVLLSKLLDRYIRLYSRL